MGLYNKFACGFWRKENNGSYKIGKESEGIIIELVEELCMECVKCIYYYLIVSFVYKLSLSNLH